MKQALGKGLGALIKNYNENVPLSTKNLKFDDGTTVEAVFKIEVNQITPNPYQPRTEFDQNSLEELKNSIKKNGLIQPITVRRGGPLKYELISGERRWRAFKELGYEFIPAYIINVDSKEKLLALALIENLQREKLNPIEIAQAYKRLNEECSLSHEEIAAQVGKDRSTIVNFIRLLKLPQEIQEALKKEEITAGHARAILSVEDPNKQIEFYKKIIANKLSVRQTEKFAKDFLENKLSSEKDIYAQLPKKSIDHITLKSIEDKLRIKFGSKVICRQKKDGAGEIVIEFYSNEELDRLLELFNEIGA